MATTDANAAPKSPEVQMMDALFREKWLADKVAAAAAENQQLKSRIEMVQNEAEQSRLKQGDLIWFYRKEAEQKEKVISSLTQTNLKLEATIREVKEKAEDEIKRMEAQNGQVKKELQEHLERLTRESKSLRDFSEQKRELEMQLAVLKSTLEAEQKEMAKKVNDLERRNVSEKERLKKEMLLKIKETKLSLLAMTEDQLHTTTKRAIMENEQMTIELQYQSKETERLLAKNSKLQTEIQRLRREVDIHKETEVKLAKRTNFFQKLIKKLNEKSKESDKTISDLQAQQAMTQRSGASKLFAENQVIRQLERQLETAMEEKRDSAAESGVLRAQLQMAKNNLAQFLELQDESVTFIWSEIERARAASRQGGGTSVADLPASERERLLSTIFERLRTLKDSFARDISLSLMDPVPPAGSSSSSSPRALGDSTPVGV
ncbi:unnamed protein product (mitochondrion) [Plasmodiophora brassicae]|uniref:Cilia- and flagella-associated protein 157 n=2 Tax=Plasmodiophora brassicae TaxID=37360 RepID=A0A3P3Y9P3_PLABS|nr:unnamed protein product [Plasmodiophora brassicae]